MNNDKYLSPRQMVHVLSSVTWVTFVFGLNILMNIVRKDTNNMLCKSADDRTHGYFLKTEHLQFCEGHSKIKLIVRKTQVTWENVNGYQWEKRNLKSQ